MGDALLPPETAARATAERLADAADGSPQQSLGRLLWTGRWLLALIYLGLLASVVLLAVKFVQNFINSVHGLLAMSSNEAILAVLQLVDITLVANLVLILVFAGWQAVIGPLFVGDARSQFSDLGFMAVKLRLISSIAAVAAVQILETFMHIDQSSIVRALWQLAILLGVGTTGVLLALMDKLSETR